MKASTLLVIAVAVLVIWFLYNYHAHEKRRTVISSTPLPAASGTKPVVSNAASALPVAAVPITSIPISTLGPVPVVQLAPQNYTPRV